MFPRPPPPAVRDDPRRSAELAVYEALDHSLSDGTPVFYGLTWLAKRRDESARDGEADFLIVERDRGLLVIEVKGGRISHDGQTGRWRSNQVEIDDPVEQARGNRYALIEKIRSLPRWKNRWVHIGHAVAFPHCAAMRGPLAPDLPREITIFAEDLTWLAEKIDAIFAYWRAKEGREEALDPEAVRLLEEVLAPTFELRQPLGALLRDEDRQIIRLTEQHFTVLNGLRRSRRVAISGGAGTGKTVLAIEKAKRLATEGYRTLLTCFNRPLAEYLQGSAGQAENLTIVNFQRLCDELAQTAGIDVEARQSAVELQTFFDDVLPEAMTEALDRLPDERFDAIVVDEGQDFHNHWWVPLQLALADPNDGILYIFHDSNQRLFRNERSLPERLTPYDLTANLRNTRTIHAVASRWYSGGKVGCLGPEGRAVEFVEAGDAKSVRRELSRILHRLVKEEQIPIEDVAILAGHRWEHSSLAGDERIGAFEITREIGGTPGKVLFETIHRFKGLERPVVVLIDIDDQVARDDAEVLYVGLTRGRLHLVVVGKRGTIEALRRTSSQPG